jgi:cytochrome c
MKKLLLSLTIASLIASCGGGDKKEAEAKPTEPITETPKDDLSKNPDYAKGLALLAQSDCFTCHKVDEKITGPTYRDVANKYENTEANVKMLAGKIIKGGKGNWGDVMMTPHSSVSEEDAIAMVKYIMLLKNK